MLHIHKTKLFPSALAAALLATFALAPGLAGAQLMVTPGQAAAAGIAVRPDVGGPIAVPGLAPVRAAQTAAAVVAPVVAPAAVAVPAAGAVPASNPSSAQARGSAPKFKAVQKKKPTAQASTVVSSSGGDGTGPAPLAAGSPSAAEAAKVDALMQKILAAQAPQGQPMPAAAGTDEILVTRGVTEIIPVPAQAMTHFSVPFQAPIVVKDAHAAAKVKSAPGGIFVSMGDEKVGLYVYDESDPENIMSLQLMPRDIPQRDIKLAMKTSSGRKNRQAEQFETAQPYVQTVSVLLTEIAQGRVPVGYTMERARGYEITCQMPGVSLRLSQILYGANMQVGVFSARNTSGAPLEIDEQSCGLDRVAAVAAYPTAMLQPGESVELYVAKKVPAQPDGFERPAVN